MADPKAMLHSMTGPGQRVVTDRLVVVVRVHENGARVPIVALIPDDSPGSPFPVLPVPLICPANDPDSVAHLRRQAVFAAEAGARVEMREFWLGRVMESFGP